MLSQEPVNPRQIKPESCREPETSSPFQQRNVNLQPPRKSVGCYIKVQGSRFRVQGSGFKVQGSRFRVQGSGFKVQGSRFRVQGSGFKVQGSRFRVQGSRFDVGCCSAFSSRWLWAACPVILHSSFCILPCQSVALGLQGKPRGIGLGILLEMELAALPRHGRKDRGTSGAQAGVVVADDELDAVETALL